MSCKCVAATFLLMKVPGQVLVLMALKFFRLLKADVASTAQVGAWFLQLAVFAGFFLCNFICRFPFWRGISGVLVRCFTAAH